MEKSENKVLSVFLRLLIFFILLGLLISGFGIYFEQTNIHNARARETIKNVAEQIEYEIKADEDDFSDFVFYLMENRERINIPADFGTWDQAKEEFDKAFEASYPDKIFGVDVSFSELSTELKDLYSIYNYEYYTNLFDSYEVSFNLPYVYFVVPTGNPEELAYIIDAEKLLREDDPNYILLVDLCLDTHEDCPILWKVWEMGTELNEWDEFNNDYGKTYSYYLPLYIHSQKTGLICVDIEVDRVNREILNSTFRIVGLMATVMLINVVIFALLFNKRVVARITKLRGLIKSYAESKDQSLADNIISQVKSKDEISSLALYFADMIKQIDQHIKNISTISNELEVEKIKAETMNELANTDLLTGLKSRIAYTNREVEIDQLVIDGKINSYAVVLIDLNYLKQINDKFGHDKGDIALINTADYIKKAFGIEDSYRIGGDEFAVIVNDINTIEEKINTFNDLMNSDIRTNKWEHISAASGYAIYDKSIDNSVADVLKRADEIMYTNKKIMKIER